MDLYSIWPCAVLLAVILGIMRLDRPFAVIDGDTGRGREHYPAIDGLRGLLAFGVFGHHAALMHGYVQTGIWRTPPSNFYTMMGEAGVALFFAITGFLFWGKLLHEHGTPDWTRLYIGRLFRIAPVYLGAVLIMLLVVWNQTYFELQEPLAAVLFDTARWLGLGLLGQPDVNGYPDTGRMLAGVTWTLRYEWLFYLFLPLLALFARRAAHLWFAAAGLVVCCALYARYGAPAAIYSGLFFCGMVSASIAHCGWRIPDRSNLALAAALGCLMLLFDHYSSTGGIVQVLLLGILFSVFSIGGTFTGILTAKPVRRLGEISYSLYLLHGLVLTAVFSVSAIRGYAMADHFSYWLVVGLCGLLTVLVATLSYVFIERPGIRLGKAVARRLAYAGAAEEGITR